MNKYTPTDQYIYTQNLNLIPNIKFLPYIYDQDYTLFQIDVDTIKLCRYYCINKLRIFTNNYFLDAFIALLKVSKVPMSMYVYNPMLKVQIEPLFDFASTLILVEAYYLGMQVMH